MKPPEGPPVRVLLYEGAGAEPIAPDRRSKILRGLLDGGLSVTCTGNGSAGSTHPADLPDGLLMIVLGAFSDGHAPLAEDAQGRVQIESRHIGDLDAAQTLSLVNGVLQERQVQVNRPGGWKPWFPVIDYDRCTNCMQCLSFCLFDVYSTSGQGQIQVQNQSNCKTDCPACSRVCPEAAIMFPKYSSGPINGDQVSAGDLKRQAMKVDISALLGGDIYASLRQRSTDAKDRFAQERDDKRALTERLRCLNKLAAKMDIPMELLTSLPSPDEIRRRAAEAMAKANAARDALQT